MNSLQNFKKTLRYKSHCCGCIQQYCNQENKSPFKQKYSDDTRKNNFSTFNGSHCQKAARVNYANIQMISAGLHKQIFKDKFKVSYDKETLHNVKEHLQDHNLWGRPTRVAEDVNLNLTLHGNNIAEHFEMIAEQESKYYFNLAEGMASILNKTPVKPNKWHLLPGWTKYNEDGSYHSVSVPEDDVLIFDVEVCLSAGKFPVLATALSKDAWYCWVSSYLCDDLEIPEEITVDMMIPIDSGEKKLVIGHNVSYDRSFTRGEYNLQGTNTRFLDTLSLHMCVSGVTNEQRNYLNSKNLPIHYDWMDVGTTNSLAKVYDFYCSKHLDKSTRDYFTEGSLEEIQENFQECVQYCSTDVSSTKEVFQFVWPMFLAHAPHPVTFAGMLEMGSSYLPINHSWNDYIDSCEKMFNNVTVEMKQTLMSVAEDALKLFIDQRYKEDPWLWGLDWSIHKSVSAGNDTAESEKATESDKTDVHAYINKSIQHLTDKRRAQLVMPGYPKWYRDLCMHKSDENFKPGPQNISSQTKVTPSLLRMTWDGYPLHYQRGHGWGYLVPKENNPKKATESSSFITRQNTSEVESDDIVKEIYTNPILKKRGIDIGMPGVKFFRLPHKDGEECNVGNPLAKDFLGKIEDGTLASSGGYNAKQTIEMNKMLAFWRNGRKRISSQHTVWMKDKNGAKCGAILPVVVTAGTVTRRAVEPTWLTASNPRIDRIGSELKSLVQAPEGYCLVGADVDSQELWIASILGDSQFAEMHGSTALSWMTLQGNKSDRTDLHSRTADTIGMSRDQAKIFNYGRIYGAGEKFAVRLLKQFNHQLSTAEAEEKAEKLYQTTKGFKKYKLNSAGMSLASELGIDIPSNGMVHYNIFKKVMSESGCTWETRADIAELNKIWIGGSESEMFNKLESIALADNPRTPVLGCLITNSLSPKYVQKHYKTSRVNWVVQSSAVDYLHLMLTCMRWLITKYKIDARFCISVHDEVRYIVHEKDKYRAALALQISNLLTRSMFSYKLKLHDLPQSVAFFSSVDIDKVWRKEVDFDCVTPSNSEGLKKSRGINPGESLNINELLKKMENDSTFRS